MARGIDQRELARVVHRLRLEVREAVANTHHLPWRRQLHAWRRGFVARQALLFDFDRFGFDAFVSEFERKRGLHRLNRRSDLFADKVMSFLYLRAIGTPTPAVHGFVEGSRVVLLGDQDGRGGVDELLDRHGKLVVKPRDGAHGAGVRLLERSRGGTRVNGQEVDGLDDVLRGRVVVSEFVEQHEYARAIFPGSTNTLRVLSLRRHDDGEPFVAAAIHRFGSERSKPVDNIELGGFTARVDLETGALGPLAAIPGASIPHGRRLVWFDEHPDTGTRVTGTVVPRWAEIVDELNRTMSLLPGFSWIGWDVAVTDDGLSIIEGNTGSGITFQVHHPLLLDDRVRALLQARGVLSPLVRPAG